MTFRVQWQAAYNPKQADFPTERQAERFAADKVAAGVAQVVIFEVGDD